MEFRMNKEVILSMDVKEFQMIIAALHMLQSKQTPPGIHDGPTPLDCLVNSVEVFAKKEHVEYR